MYDYSCLNCNKDTNIIKGFSKNIYQEICSYKSSKRVKYSVHKYFYKCNMKEFTLIKITNSIRINSKVGHWYGSCDSSMVITRS